MIDRLKKYFELIPFVAPIIYLFGFTIINGYLSNYGYSDYKILSFTYLRAGVLFFVLLTLIFLSVWFAYNKKSMTDDITKSWKSVLASLNNVLLITYLISSLLVDNKFMFNHKVVYFIFIICIFLLNIFNSWKDREHPNNNTVFLILVLPGILLLLILNLILAYNCQFATYLLIFNLCLTILITFSLGIYGDKRYKERLVIDLIILVIASFAFGSKIYGIVPMKIGGGEPYRMIVDNNCLDASNKINSIDTLNVIYENDDRFILQKKRGDVFTINKNEIKCFFIVKK